MAKRGEKLEKSFDRLSERQLDIYATELQDHYHEERRLRRELEKRNQELEQRVNELLSLNRLFQKFMAQSFASSDSVSAILPNAAISEANPEYVPQDTAIISGEDDLSGPNKVQNNSDGTASEATA